MTLRNYGAMLCAVALLVMFAPTASAQMNCDDDSITSVSSSGAILEMLSGGIYRVADVDRITSALWLPISDVLVCRRSVVYQGNRYVIVTIINRDDDGEEVMAERLR